MYLMHDNVLQSVVQITQQWLTMNRNSKNSVDAQSTRLDGSAALSISSHPKEVGAQVSEEMNFPAGQSSRQRAKTSFIRVLM